MSQIKKIDLEVISLFGFQQTCCTEVVDSIVRGIEAGDEFPAIDIHHLSDLNFVISPFDTAGFDSCDGGHHRAVGHYIANQKLKVNFCGLLGFTEGVRRLIPISKIKLVDSPDTYKCLKQMQFYR